MSIQSNINQGISIAGYLFSQTLGKDIAARKQADKELATSTEAFDLASKSYQTEIQKYNEELNRESSKANPRHLKEKADEVMKSGAGPAYESAKERAIGAAEKVYQLDPTPENLEKIQKFTGAEPAKLAKDFETDVAKREEDRQKKNEQRKAAKEKKRQQELSAQAAADAERALSEERQRMIMTGVYTGPHNVKEV